MSSSPQLLMCLLFIESFLKNFLHRKFNISHWLWPTHNLSPETYFFLSTKMVFRGIIKTITSDCEDERKECAYYKDHTVV